MSENPLSKIKPMNFPTSMELMYKSWKILNSTMTNEQILKKYNDSVIESNILHADVLDA